MPLVDKSECYQMTNVGDHIDGTDVYQSNRNLLDNPWFGSGEVVNQRGVTSGSTTNATYFIDRWLITYGSAAGTYSVGSNGITLTPASGTTCTMYQKLANASAIGGKVVTASVLLSDGTIYSGTITRANGTTQNYYYNNGVRIRQVTDNGFHIDVSLNGGVTIRAAKLELGSVSTLANDAPPDLITERSKCQAHALVLDSPAPLGFGYFDGNDNTTAYILVPTPTEMRAKPTVSYSSSIVVRWVTSSGTMGSGSASSVLVYAYTPSGVILRLTVTGITGIPCVAYCPGKITLSADL